MYSLGLVYRQSITHIAAHIHVAPPKSGSALPPVPSCPRGDVGEIGECDDDGDGDGGCNGDGDDAVGESNCPTSDDRVRAGTYARSPVGVVGGGPLACDQSSVAGDGGTSLNDAIWMLASIPKSSIIPRGGGRSTIASRSCEMWERVSEFK